MKYLVITLVGISLAISCKTNKTETYDAAESNVQTRAAERGGSATSGDRSERRGRRVPPSIDEVFKMDVDGDGRLAQSEVADSPMSRNFSKIDTNGDGFITREEFNNAPKPEKGQHPRRGN